MFSAVMLQAMSLLLSSLLFFCFCCPVLFRHSSGCVHFELWANLFENGSRSLGAMCMLGLLLHRVDVAPMWRQWLRSPWAAAPEVVVPFLNRWAFVSGEISDAWVEVEPMGCCARGAGCC